MNRVLVTGGAGHIGSHLAERLLGAGAEVRVLDDFSTGRRENLAAVADHPRLTVIEGSVTDPDAVARAAEGAATIYHLAASVGVMLIVARPVATLETNIRGTEVVLQAAARTGAAVFLASSSEVYGKGRREAFDEDDDLVIGSSRYARWGYACSKAVDEFLAMAYAREHDLPVLVGRLFNTIGPRQVGAYGMVVPRFVEAALRGEPLRVFGYGEQTRCFADVRDTVEAIDRLTAGAAAGRPAVYNIGGDREISINDLAALVVRLAGSASGIEHVPYDEAYGVPMDDLERRRPSLGRARAVLGPRWPHHALEETLRELIAAAQ